MTRPLRLEYPGSLWHITARGNAKQTIFLDDADRERFVELLATSVKRFAWILPAYVLMLNHFHLVVQLTAETLSQGMQWLNATYSQHFNRRHQRVGHVFQGRFKSFLVDKETYFLEVLRYVVLNPVRARLVVRPEEYAWSSHRAVLGIVPAPEWLACDDVLAAFGPSREVARRQYRDFVDAAIGADASPWKDLTGQIYLGSETWLESVREKIELKPRADEFPREQRSVAGGTMSDAVAAVANAFAIDEEHVRRKPGAARQIAAWIAANEMRLTNRQIAAGLHLRSQGHVSDLIREAERAVNADAGVRLWIDACISTLRGTGRNSKL